MIDVHIYLAGPERKHIRNVEWPSAVPLPSVGDSIVLEQSIGAPPRWEEESFEVLDVTPVVGFVADHRPAALRVRMLVRG